MNKQRWFVLIGFAGAMAFAFYFTSKLFGAFITGASAIIFDFNMYSEFYWELPFFFVLTSVSFVAFLLLFRMWSKE